MRRATLIGFSAVAMWALLALLTDASAAVPPFAEPSVGILAACLLITAGAVLAARSLLFGRTVAAAAASA